MARNEYIPPLYVRSEQNYLRLHVRMKRCFYFQLQLSFISAFFFPFHNFQLKRLVLLPVSIYERDRRPKTKTNKNN